MKKALPLLAAALFAPLFALHAADKPSIVFLLADDLAILWPIPDGSRWP